MELWNGTVLDSQGVRGFASRSEEITVLDSLDVDQAELGHAIPGLSVTYVG